MTDQHQNHEIDDNEDDMPEFGIMAINLAPENMVAAMRADPRAAVDFTMRAFQGIMNEMASTISGQDSLRVLTHVSATLMAQAALKIISFGMPDDLSTWDAAKAMARESMEHYWEATIAHYEAIDLPAKLREEHREERESVAAERQFAEAEAFGQSGNA